MTDDAKIKAALRQEEARMLLELDGEPGYISQAMSLFKGPTGAASFILYVAQIVMFVGGVWLAIRFFNATEPLEAIRNGIPAATLILAALMSKLSLWPQLHANRVIREMRRLEVQILRADD